MQASLHEAEVLEKHLVYVHKIFQAHRHTIQTLLRNLGISILNNYCNSYFIPFPYNTMLSFLKNSFFVSLFISSAFLFSACSSPKAQKGDIVSITYTARFEDETPYIFT
jgi:hypothetical protein